MTFLLHRKRPITHRAAPARLAQKIISALFASAIGLSAAQAQPFIPVPSEPITPKFIPAPQAPVGVVPAVANEAPTRVTPVAAVAQPVMQGAGKSGDAAIPLVRTELPGPQQQFKRESETQFFQRIAQDKQLGGRAIFPEEKLITTEKFRPRSFPRMVGWVEPSYVCHGRLYFEQPNFERIGYDFGVLQPAISLGVFYYDTALFPYHFWTDLSNRTECSTGKCLPGDPAPLMVYRERFSVTGLLGQSGAMFGLGFLFP